MERFRFIRNIFTYTLLLFYLIGPKFVLQIYRDYKYTGSKRFLVDIYPMVLQVISRAESFDTDGDGMIENQGFPDQT